MSETRAFTFGVQYRHSNPHPTADYAHADGYVAIAGRDYAEVRQIAVEHFGTAWAFDYPMEKMRAEGAELIYPLGLLATIDGTGAEPILTAAGEDVRARTALLCEGGDEQ